jgi:serine protease
LKNPVPSLIGALALALLAPLAAHAAPTPPGAASARVIVKFKADSTLLRKQAASAGERHAAQAQALGARVGLPLAAGHGIADRMQVVFASGMSSEALAARLAQEKDVEYAVPDRRKRRAEVPLDPRYLTVPVAAQTGGPESGQWYLRPPTSTVSAINAETAWNLTTGSPSVVVAVLDTGVRFDHADLGRVSNGGNLLDGYDMISDVPTANDGDGRDSDASDPGDFLTQADIDSGEFDPCAADDIAASSWHGTQMSAIVGALTGNNVGMASVGRSVRVLPVRVLGKCGGFDSDIVAGMLWAAGIVEPGSGLPTNNSPASVINLSLGGGGVCTQLYADAVAAVRAAGVTVVASAGNGAGQAVSEPANCEGVIGVAGVRHEGDKAPYSDLGPEVSISAPGGNCVNDVYLNPNLPCLYPILSASNGGELAPVSDAAGGSIYTDAFNYAIGTSYSAPLVAGTAALMLSARPELSPTEVRRLLMGSARAFPVYQSLPTCHAPDGSEQLQCNCTTDTCGAGMLDAAQSVAAALGPIVRIGVTPAQPLAGSLLTLTSDQTSVLGGRSITGYQWTLVDGGGIVSALAGATTASVTTTPIGGGVFVVSLAVTDSTGATGTQTVEVTVAGDPPSSGGGGGALGWPWLAALALAVAALNSRRAGSRGRASAGAAR